MTKLDFISFREETLEGEKNNLMEEKVRCRKAIGQGEHSSERIS